MKKLILLFMALVMSLGMAVCAQAQEGPEDRVILGDERSDVYLPLLRGKKVALFTNQSGIVGNEENGAHILDTLLEEGVDVVAVFCPEHGFRGTQDAGANIESSVDEKTGVPLLSLYSSDKTHSPAADPENSFWGVPDDQGRYWIDLLSGSDALRTMTEAGMSAEQIEESWQEDIDLFLIQREPYLLYE